MSAPHLVTSADELGELYADLGTSQIHPHLSVLDADGRPWIIWDTEFGDWLASSLPMEDDGEDPNAWSRVNADSLVMPVTILTPAPTSTPSVEMDDVAHEVWAHATASLCRSPTCIYVDGERDADYENDCPHCKVAASQIATAVLALFGLQDSA